VALRDENSILKKRVSELEQIINRVYQAETQTANLLVLPLPMRPN
jgi:hypothetical protein